MSELDESSPGQIILGWWSRALFDQGNPTARALAARLRRASPASALAEPEVHALAVSLGLLREDATRLSLLARLLADVRHHRPAPLAWCLGGIRPILSPSRFQRLVQAEGVEFHDLMRRAIRVADCRCNVALLGQDILQWNDKTRMTWCFQYFGESVPQSEDLEFE